MRSNELYYSRSFEDHFDILRAHPRPSFDDWGSDVPMEIINSSHPLYSHGDIEDLFSQVDSDVPIDLRYKETFSFLEGVEIVPHIPLYVYCYIPKLDIYFYYCFLNTPASDFYPKEDLNGGFAPPYANYYRKINMDWGRFDLQSKIGFRGLKDDFATMLPYRFCDIEPKPVEAFRGNSSFDIPLRFFRTNDSIAINFNDRTTYYYSTDGGKTKSKDIITKRNPLVVTCIEKNDIFNNHQHYLKPVCYYHFAYNPNDWEDALKLGEVRMDGYPTEGFNDHRINQPHIPPPTVIEIDNSFSSDSVSSSDLINSGIDSSSIKPTGILPKTSHLVNSDGSTSVTFSGGVGLSHVSSSVSSRGAVSTRSISTEIMYQGLKKYNDLNKK